MTKPAYVDQKTALQKRLKRIEGQVRGLERMVDEAARPLGGHGVPLRPAERCVMLDEMPFGIAADERCEGARIGTGAGAEIDDTRVTWQRARKALRQFCIARRRVRLMLTSTENTAQRAHRSLPCRFYNHDFLRGERLAKSSAISFIVTNRTPACEAMCL